MLDYVLTMPFRVTDLKQWVYCPRILYYHHCLPDVRPVTYKMKAGVEAGRAEEGREERRSLRTPLPALPRKGGGEYLIRCYDHLRHHNRQAEWIAAIPPVRLR